jgi:hypothetical protein
MRKEKGLQVTDEIDLLWFSEDSLVIKVFESYNETLKGVIKAKSFTKKPDSSDLIKLAKENLHVKFLA